MSETTGTTEPTKATQPVNTQSPPPDSVEEPQGGTQEIKVKRPKKKLGGRIGRFLLNALIFLLIIGLGIFGGYQSGINIRQRAQSSLVNQQLSDQFARALVDIQFGSYDAAKTRLEYIIGIDPNYPGAMEKLTEVMVLSSVPTATPYVSPTPELIIVDDTDYNGMFAQAQQLIATQQWQNALTVLSTIRRKDPTFNAVQIDGMYYFALRNLGVEQIHSGNLEGGIYQLALAERFAPLDNTAQNLQENSRAYINAASFWELDWQRAAEQFAQLNGSGLWDGTMTATERYKIAATRYGDQLYGEGRYCEADEQYTNAQSAGPLDEASVGQARDAHLICYPPTATPGPVATQPPATQPPATQPPATQPPAYPNP